MHRCDIISSLRSSEAALTVNASLSNEENSSLFPARWRERPSTQGPSSGATRAAPAHAGTKIYITSSDTSKLKRRASMAPVRTLTIELVREYFLLIGSTRSPNKAELAQVPVAHADACGRRPHF